jgi:hypothetical protein
MNNSRRPKNLWKVVISIANDVSIGFGVSVIVSVAAYTLLWFFLFFVFFIILPRDRLGANWAMQLSTTVIVGSTWVVSLILSMVFIRKSTRLLTLRGRAGLLVGGLLGWDP